MKTRLRSSTQELVTRLYLRMNGFFTSGFIVHSPEWGKNRTEIDTLGVRFRYSCEPERGVDPDPFLENSSALTDLVICEVKSKRRPLQFNNSLIEDDKRIASVLRWAGLFTEDEVMDLAPSVREALKSPKGKIIPCVEAPRESRVRGFLCCPDRTDNNEASPWFIGENVVFNYLWTCFCPDAPRPRCSTRYDFTLWGEFQTIVTYFKGRTGQGPGTFSDLYDYIQSSEKLSAARPKKR